MPRIADIEGTPNKNALKFILKEPLTWGITHSYDNAEDAKDDPLASALFDIDHVTNVFYVDRWITITQDGEANWQDLAREVADPIRAAPAATEQSKTTVAAANTVIAGLSPEDQQRLERINVLLDEEVRPYLQNDGGDLHVLGLEGDILRIHYQGACGTCPSSISGTLRGIEHMLKAIEPDIRVVAS
ncbi:Fe-S cluster biogenesis protein NfuA, 4Fe-4S-binding domain [Nitrosomonas cryotolerans]|uniref:Fe-S cluster biogenesis protein NfuA, 4Fe-4S-binding domain n=1 Tax=Nitrosomonas cryotolerans ATCC 49181 TaxID=1131553 RepID=A0A1N6ID13_9PROT|nr:NifU family protein [Nitrosomonas cryotolerans]SFP60810.1 Fe-S cluster biogenesis protein NfuA, 4Fe-4S-binding domain [Nitrosomonas cryotolerans]SIO29869.1 Fe-S cluster biogenesis protein NfuA, 4Fe-4S-binding domain [Nitrosomonas cryotolerans ATCC 49181]